MSLGGRVVRKVRGLLLSPKFRQYQDLMDPRSPLQGLPMRIVGDASADPTETFDHYDAFAFWAAAKIRSRQKPLAILDVGSKKIMNAILSTEHDVTSLVLADCADGISNVRYLKHDVSVRLPFDAMSFDVFTSMVSLPLVGLGRYGDQLNPNCLPNLVSELTRVVKNDGDLLVSMCLGKNILNFNNGWFLDVETIKRIFLPWHLADYLVDNWSSPTSRVFGGQTRFSKSAEVDATNVGDYRVIFLQFTRSTQGSHS